MPSLTGTRLRELFRRDKDTGKFIRLSTKGNTKSGKIAGCRRKDGYFIIQIDGSAYYEHRLIWLWETGEYPSNEIDHINGNKSDNRLCNLRLASSSENKSNKGPQSNNTSGFKGVSWSTRKQKWCAQIVANSRCKFIGYFSTQHEAALAYDAACKDYHGKFAWLNFPHD